MYSTSRSLLTLQGERGCAAFRMTKQMATKTSHWKAQEEDNDMMNNCLIVNALLDKTGRIYPLERHATTRRYQVELYIALAVESGAAFH